MKEKLSAMLSADWAVGRLLPAFLILFIAFFAGRCAGRIVRRIASRIPQADASIEALAGNAVTWAVYLVGGVAALAAFGINTGGIMAALGGIALAIGLGLRDTLSNVAAGITLLVLRPLAAGEFVTFGADARSSGTVVRVGLFETELRTVEGVFLAVPNRVLLQEPIANYGRNPERLVRLAFPISYSDSIETGLRTLLALGTAEPRRLPDRPAEVFVEGLGESSVDLSLRVWVKTADYWPARRALVEAGKCALEAAGLTIPFPQRDVHLRGGAAPAREG